MIRLRVKSFSCSSRALRAAAIVLKAPARAAISSCVVTATRVSRSPSATRREAFTSARTGVDSRRETKKEMAVARATPPRVMPTKSRVERVLRSV